MPTSIPQAVPAFISIAQAALPSTVQVRFAQRFGPFIAPQTLLITNVRITKDDFAELGPTYRHEEHFAIECTMCSAVGNDDEATRMLEVFNNYSLVSVAVANNPTLNNTVRVCHCQQIDYGPTYDPKGFSVGELTFAVDCEARVTSLQ